MLGSKHRRRVVAPQTGEIVTKQYPKDECDINNILSQYKKTGIINHINSMQGEFIDLPSELDYQAAMNLGIRASEAFASLPAVVRDRFRNDPRYLLAALGNPAFKAELEGLGVLRKPESAAPPPASGPGSVPVPGTGPISGPTAPPPQAPGTNPA